MSYNNNFKK